MTIGIDISQIVYTNTGVANYVRDLVRELVKKDKKNKYILFGSSLRNRYQFVIFYKKLKKINKNIELVISPIPPSILSFLWNTLHIFSINKFIGKVDFFWSSDWVQPPLGNTIGITTIHDLIVYKYPEGTHPKTEVNFSNLLISPNIVETQKKRLKWVARECRIIFCDSMSTRDDCMKLLGIEKDRLYVIYPGIN